MKIKLLLIALILPFVLSAQQKTSQANTILEKSKKWFKEVYVKDNFKDPYSYTHVKSWIEKYTYGDSLKYALLSVKLGIENAFTEQEAERLAQEGSATIDRLKAATPAQLNKVLYYFVHIDCYGKNSYGNKVLQRFQFDVSTKGVPGEVSSEGD